MHMPLFLQWVTICLVSLDIVQIPQHGRLSPPCSKLQAVPGTPSPPIQIDQPLIATRLAEVVFSPFLLISTE